MNLQAMLNIDDFDKIILLLEQNNWSENQAANAYYAQQMAGAGPPAQNEEMKMDENAEGYRAPI